MSDTATASQSFSLNLPDWRRDLYEELHARPFPFVHGNAQISQISCHHDASGGEGQRRHVQNLCNLFYLQGPTEDASCYYAQIQDYEFRWEMHTEFSSYTFIRHDKEQQPFSKKAVDALPTEWLQSMPGSIVSAVHISVMDMPESMESLDVLRQNFSDQRLIGSKIGENEAQVWTSFLTQEDGFSRFLIHNRLLNKCQMGRLVQRLLEIETYRLFSLLTLPLAKSALSEINRMDEDLCNVVKGIPDINTHAEEKALLKELSGFSANIESLRAKINYRSNATQAYAQLVKKRIQELNEVPHPGLQTLNDFMARRFAPAVRTILSMSDRLDDLSTRIDRATDLIRTKVDLEIEKHNQALLSSLDDRGQRQYRLQRTVEGLSVVAISYYLVELIKLTVPGTRWLGLEINPDDVAVFSVPLILTLMILISRVVRRKLD